MWWNKFLDKEVIRIVLKNRNKLYVNVLIDIFFYLLALGLFGY